MASGIQVKLDKWKPSSVYARSLLRGPTAQRIVTGPGQKVRANAASMFGATGYGIKLKVGSTRARMIIYTQDLHAMRSNMVHNTLAKAVNS